jgi:hypothetical protein
LTVKSLLRKKKALVVLQDLSGDRNGDALFNYDTASFGNNLLELQFWLILNILSP